MQKQLISRAAPHDAPTILWVHGYAMDSRIWPPLWARMPRFHHKGVDLPGHGHGRALRANDGLASFGQEVADAALMFDARFLVGLSFGATVALQAAIDNPGLFDRIALASPGLASDPEDQEAADCNQELIALMRDKGIGHWLRARWMARPPEIFTGATRYDALFRQLWDIIGDHSWTELTGGQLSEMRRERQSSRDIGKIAAKLLILVGDADLAAFTRSAEIIRKSARNATRHYLRNCGHLTILESPDDGANELTTFFSGI